MYDFIDFTERNRYQTVYTIDGEEVREWDIMHDYDSDKYIDSYCKSQKCSMCDGTDYNGEPNGYGCAGLEQRQINMYDSILHRRIKKMIKEGKKIEIKKGWVKCDDKNGRTTKKTN